MKVFYQISAAVLVVIGGFSERVGEHNAVQSALLAAIVFALLAVSEKRP